MMTGGWEVPAGIETSDPTIAGGLWPGLDAHRSAVMVAFQPLSSHLVDPDVVFYLVVGFVAGLAAIYLGAKQWRVGKLLQNTASERIRSIAVGRTEVDGTCRDVGITYDQPYAEGQCVYRHWEVAEERATGDGSDEWVTVQEGTDVAPFFVEDDTGRVLVDTTDAPHFEISTANSYETTVDAGSAPPPEVLAFSPDEEPPGGAIWGSDDAHTDAGDEAGEDQASAMDRQQVIEEHVDDSVLTDEGSLRQDVTAAQLRQAVDEDAENLDVSDFFVGTTGSGATPGEQAAGRTGAGVGPGESSTGGDAAEVDPEAIVDELGGLGEAGDLGTGASLGRRVIDAALGSATGPWGSAGGEWSPLSGTTGGADRSNRRRYTHEVLPVGEAVYVFGAADPRPTAGGANEEMLKLVAEPETGQFIVSDRDEQGIVDHYTNHGPQLVFVGLVVSTLCLGGLLWMLGL